MKQINSFEALPLTSCDVERTFSAYTNILTNKERSFVSENRENYHLFTVYEEIE